MLKRICLLALCAVFIVMGAMAQQVANEHSATITITPSPSAATCLSTATIPCTFYYDLFEGSGTGLESPTPLNSTPLTGLTYTDSGLFAGTTRCYYATYTQTVGGVVSTSANSNEACYTWPAAPGPPAITIQGH
jgi:hypothetical protein